MHLVVVGINHNTAPVELRERLAVDESDLERALYELGSHPRVSEACIISTCNRTEIYAVTRSRVDDTLLMEFLLERAGVEHSEMESCIYIHPGHHAVQHLYEVACGLDSMVLGETQILGQIKNAYCVAGDSHSTGNILNNLFQKAIAVGKRARTETAISSGAFSIGAAAVELARFVFGNLRGRRALLLGAGKMSRLAATHLASNGVEKIYVASRTPAKVEELVNELGGEPVEMERFEEALTHVDVVISSTSAKQAIITRELMEHVMTRRPCSSPIFLIDIAVPRDIEPSVADIEGVFLYNIDDLTFMVDHSRVEREKEVEKVRAIIEEEVSEFMEYLRTLEAMPLIKQLRDKFEAVYLAEWERCNIRLSHLSEEERECVRKSIKSAVTKLTHDPILRMKEYAVNGGKDKLDIVRELFGLTTETAETAKAKEE